MINEHEYRNDFLYFVLKPGPAENSFFYCSGINLTRFNRLTRNRHRLGANPVLKGLQILRLGVTDLALSRGATPKSIRGDSCSGLSSPNDLWYKEHLLIENASAPLAGEILEYCPSHLFRSIFKAMAWEITLPVTYDNPRDLQAFLEALCREYGSDFYTTDPRFADKNK